MPMLEMPSSLLSLQDTDKECHVLRDRALICLSLSNVLLHAQVSDGPSEPAIVCALTGVQATIEAVTAGGLQVDGRHTHARMHARTLARTHARTRAPGGPFALGFDVYLARLRCLYCACFIATEPLPHHGVFGASDSRNLHTLLQLRYQKCLSQRSVMSDA